MSDPRPIGIFDSGLGGLTVVREIMRLMPGERMIYLGDTARFPYGGRSAEAITTFGLQDARYLVSKDIKMLIVACNTVSAVALEAIQKEINDIPVIGVVLPGARAAVERTAERKVGVIGTIATIRTEAYATAIKAINPGIEVYSRPCPLFAPLVEEAMLDDDITRLVAQRYLYEMVDSGIDCLILGCTHYPLLLEVIQETVGNRVALLDSALWAAKEARTIISAISGSSDSKENGLLESTFYVTDLNQRFTQSARIFLGQDLPRVEKIELEELVATA